MNSEPIQVNVALFSVCVLRAIFLCVQNLFAQVGLTLEILHEKSFARLNVNNLAMRIASLTIQHEHFVFYHIKRK